MHEKLQEAVSLYKKGHKSEASKLLMDIIQQEPGNSVAWYGLALSLDEPDRKIYCLKKVLSLDPSNKKAQQNLEQLQASEKSASNQKNSEVKPSPITKKGSSTNGLGVVALGVVGIMLISIIIGVVLLGINAYRPISTPIPPVSIPRSSHAPSIFTGEPTEYLPKLPDGYAIDYSISQIDSTLSDGTRLFSIAFRNKQAVSHGDLVTVIYFINIYPSEAKATSEYRKYLSNLKSNNKGTLDSEIGIRGADDSAMYLEGLDNNTLSGQYTSRVKNVIITTMGSTIYDTQELTEASLKSFMAEVGAIQILSIEKLSPK